MKKQKGFIVPILIAIVTILIIGGGVYVYQNNKTSESQLVDNQLQSNSQDQKKDNQTSDQNLPAPTPSVSASINLKTYTNIRHGYSIQFPSEAVVTWNNRDLNNSSCVTIKKGLGFIIINSGSQDVCGATGVGVGSIRINEDVQVGGKNYSATGFTSKTNTSTYWFNFDLTDKISIYFGVSSEGENRILNNTEYVKTLADIKNILGTLKLTSMTSIPMIKQVHQYDSDTLNTFASDFGGKITVAGENLFICKNPRDCETLVYVGDKSFSLTETPSDGNTVSFIPSRLGNGEYDLYLFNPVTGVKSNSIKVKVSNILNAVITPTFPHGGETFKPGQHVLIKWESNPVTTKYYPNGFSAVNLQVVSNTTKKCPQGYTNNGSMGTCRGYEIYNGANTGSFDWVIPSNYPGAGNYMIRIWPDIGMESSHDISSKGFDTDGYSGSFGITN
ncbi:MAG: hypothetical protein WCO16_01905 [bacterium]